MEWNGEGARGRDEYEMRSESSPETAGAASEIGEEGSRPKGRDASSFLSSLIARFDLCVGVRRGF